MLSTNQTHLKNKNKKFTPKYLEDPFQYKISVLSNRASSPPSSLRHRGPYSTPYCTSRCQGQVVRKYIESIYIFYLIFIIIYLCIYLLKFQTEMYFGVFQRPVQVQPTTGMRTRSSPSLLTAPNKMPRTFKLRGFTSEGYREALKAQSSGVKKPPPEKSFLHSRSPKGKKAPCRLLISQRKPLLCPSEEREWERRKKKERVGRKLGK